MPNKRRFALGLCLQQVQENAVAEEEDVAAVEEEAEQRTWKPYQLLIESSKTRKDFDCACVSNYLQLHKQT